MLERVQHNTSTFVVDNDLAAERIWLLQRRGESKKEGR
jgi:hypothetical protein